MSAVKREVDTIALYSALLGKKEEEGRSWRAISRDLGIDNAIFTRLYKGSRPDGDTLLTLTAWLGVSPERFMSGQAAERDERRDTMVAIRTHLRADRRLSDQSAEAIEAVVRAAYDQLAEPSASSSAERAV